MPVYTLKCRNTPEHISNLLSTHPPTHSSAFADRSRITSCPQGSRRSQHHVLLGNVGASTWQQLCSPQQRIVQSRVPAGSIGRGKDWDQRERGLQRGTKRSKERLNSRFEHIVHWMVTPAVATKRLTTNPERKTQQHLHSLTDNVHNICHILKITRRQGDDAHSAFDAAATRGTADIRAGTRRSIWEDCSTKIQGVTSTGGKQRPSQPLARRPLWDSRSGK